MREIWKEIEGYEGCYMVSNKGRVMSLVDRSGIHGEVIEVHRKKIMKPFDNGRGYLCISLRDTERHRKNHYIHRLVALMFIDNPNGYSCVNHLDYDRKNNRVDNLEWCTPKDNVRYSSERMRHPKTKCKASSTGEKYVHRRIHRNGNVYYRVSIKPLSVDKSFKTLIEAVAYRDGVMK